LTLEMAAQHVALIQPLLASGDDIYSSSDSDTYAQSLDAADLAKSDDSTCIDAASEQSKKKAQRRFRSCYTLPLTTIHESVELEFPVYYSVLDLSAIVRV
jgi:hypothetical protein